MRADTMLDGLGGACLPTAREVGSDPQGQRLELISPDLRSSLREFGLLP